MKYRLKSKYVFPDEVIDIPSNAIAIKIRFIDYPIWATQPKYEVVYLEPC